MTDWLGTVKELVEAPDLIRGFPDKKKPVRMILELRKEDDYDGQPLIRDSRDHDVKLMNDAYDKEGVVEKGQAVFCTTGAFGLIDNIKQDDTPVENTNGTSGH